MLNFTVIGASCRPCTARNCKLDQILKLRGSCIHPYEIWHVRVNLCCVVHCQISAWSLYTVVRLFFVGISPAYSGLQRLWTPVRRPSAGPMRLPRERGGELVGVCSVCATCRRGGLSRREQLVRYLLMRPVKAWLTVWRAGLVLMQRQPTSACAALAPADAYAA